jgi:hypothetical protein
MAGAVIGVAATLTDTVQLALGRNQLQNLGINQSIID